MKRIRIGVFGARRGMELAKNFMLLNCDITAICESDAKAREQASKSLGDGVSLYENFEAFLQHDMDAVILANYFHEHAPYAVLCLERNIHVFSECISNGTMADGVALIRAAEKSNAVYMLAENYPHMLFNREIKRIYENKSLGKLLYAEGEYNHPVDPEDIDFLQSCIYTSDHWRNFLPATYYITHSLGPLMYATGASPQKVTAFATFAPLAEQVVHAKRSGDLAAIITTQNTDGSVFRVTGCAGFGGAHHAYRICGTDGQIENLRGLGSRIMLRYNEWSIPEGYEEINMYEPVWNDCDEILIRQSGHGGADFITARMFVDCVRQNKQPPYPFDVFGAVQMSSVGILAHRSVLSGGMPYDIPDFRQETWRKVYENDRKSPFCAPTDENYLACCSHPDYCLTQEQIEGFNELVKDF